MKTEESVMGGNGHEPFSFTQVPTVQYEVRRESEIVRLPLGLASQRRRTRRSLGWFQKMVGEVIFEAVDHGPLTGKVPSLLSRVWAMRHDPITQRGALVLSFGAFALLLIMVAVLPSIVDWFYGWH